MNRFQELLSRRVAGIPVGVIAVIVAALVLVVALRMRKSATPTTDPDTATDEPAGDGDIGGTVTNPTFQASPTTPTVVAVTAEDTNELWAVRARTWLVGIGMNPTLASQLVGKYLNSEPLTSDEKQEVDAVVRQLGFPPDPPELIDLTPEDAPTVTTPETPTAPGNTGNGPKASDVMPPTKQGTPPTHHVVKNARDNGPGELANLYYGSNAPAKVARLEAANWELGAGPWSVGTIVKVPDDHPAVYFVATADVRGLNQIAGKNGVDPHFITVLNPGVNFPVKKGDRVRVN